MLNLIRGQKIKLNDVLQGQNAFYIQIQYQASFILDLPVLVWMLNIN